MARKGYPAEFRRRALGLVVARKTVAEVARLLVGRSVVAGRELRRGLPAEGVAGSAVEGGGDCYDTMIEAFWSRMQVELLDSRRWKTRVELANAIFEYIEIFHNRRRRHSSLGMRTPIEYELLNTTAAVA